MVMSKSPGLYRRWDSGIGTSMNKAIDYRQPIIVKDQITAHVWPAKYVGPHRTIPGWHTITSDGSLREVDDKGHVLGPLADLRVENRN
jgi:hypothetical protein